MTLQELGLLVLLLLPPIMVSALFLVTLSFEE